MTRQGRIHFRKTDNPYPMEMIQQAYPTLEALNLFGGLTSWQVCKLLFLNHLNSKGEPRGEVAARRAVNHYCLRRLKDLGLVKVKPIVRTDNALAKWEINHLTPKGYQTLKEHRESHNLVTLPFRNPANLTYQTINPHAMGIKDAGISAMAASRRIGVTVELYLDDLTIRSMSKQGKLTWPMEPDFFVILSYNGIRQPFFGEVDLGTESIDSHRANSWSTKMQNYKHFSQVVRLNDPILKDLPQPQLMVIAPSDRRLDNLKEQTARSGGRSSYWFTTSELIEPPFSFFGNVWQRIGLPGYYSPTERFAS